MKLAERLIQQQDGAAVRTASGWLKLGVLAGVLVVLAVLAGIARWRQGPE